jgi:hypothetical protein
MTLPGRAFDSTGHGVVARRASRSRDGQSCRTRRRSLTSLPFSRADASVSAVGAETPGSDDLRARRSTARRLCVALAEQESEEVGPAHLVLVRSGSFDESSGRPRSVRERERCSRGGSLGGAASWTACPRLGFTRCCLFVRCGRPVLCRPSCWAQTAWLDGDDDLASPGYDYGNEDEFGLDVILDGLERGIDAARDASAGHRDDD